MDSSTEARTALPEADDVTDDQIPTWFTSTWVGVALVSLKTTAYILNAATAVFHVSCSASDHTLNVSSWAAVFGFLCFLVANPLDSIRHRAQSFKMAPTTGFWFRARQATTSPTYRTMILWSGMLFPLHSAARMIGQILTLVGLRSRFQPKTGPIKLWGTSNSVFFPDNYNSTYFCYDFVVFVKKLGQIFSPACLILWNKTCSEYWRDAGAWIGIALPALDQAIALLAQAYEQK